MKFKQRTASTKRPISRVVLLIVTAAFVMSAAPAQAAPVAAGSSTASDATQIRQAVPQGLDAPFAAAEQVANPAIVGAIILCSSGAAGNVGFGVLERLISEGNVGRARELLADAIIGCATPIVGAIAWRVCRRVPPCRNAVDRALNAAIDRIIREIQGGLVAPSQ